MTRILIRAYKDPWTALTAEQTLAQRALADNVGNLLFSQSVHRVLSVPGTTVSPDGYSSHRRGHEKALAEEINANYDAFVIPLANAFRPGFQPHLKKLTKLVQRLRIPVTVVGVGSQHKLDVDRDGEDPIAEDVKKFMAAVLDRSASVGVRGEYTAEYLSGLGFGEDVVDVIGCPSIFLNGDIPVVEKSLPELNTDSPIALTVSPYVRQMKPIVARHTKVYPNLIYIPQNHKDLNMMVWGENRTTPKDLRNPTHTRHPLYEQDRMRFPLDPKTWLEYLSGFDFAFGTRIHGTVAGILAGTPTMLLAHDTRTLELAEYHAIPHLKITEINAKTDAAELYERVDYWAFADRQPEVLARYTAFLEKNGLEHSFAPGQDAVEFDAQVNAATLPPIVHTLCADNVEGRRAIVDRISSLWSNQADMEKRLEALETTAASSPAAVDTAPSASQGGSAQKGSAGRGSAQKGSVGSRSAQGVRARALSVAKAVRRKLRRS